MNSTIKQDFRLILASGSPRRRELLSGMGYSFEIIVPDVDENVSGHARDVVAILSRRKAEAIAKNEDHGIVIASDTLVSLDGHALGLSGRTHEVFTGVTIIDAATSKSETRSVRTGVRFRKISDEEIWAYILTGEPMDKAGAYGIQGGAGKFVDGYEGSYENVIGFPVDDIREMLSSFID